MAFADNYKDPNDFPCTDSCSLTGQFNSTKWDFAEQQERIPEDDEDNDNDWEEHVENF